MLASHHESRVQCHGCERWFSPSGLSQHVSKTGDMRCRDALTVSRFLHASSSIQRAAMPQQLSPNGAPPVSLGRSDSEIAVTQGSSDTEIAATRGSSDTEIAAAQGVCYCFFSFAHVRIISAISDTDDISSIVPPDPADVADADAYEELLRESLATTLPDPTTLPEVPEIPNLTQWEDQTEEDNQADLAPSQGCDGCQGTSTVVDEFPFGSPGMPIPDKSRGSTVYESRQAASTSTDSLWAPFRSEFEWKIARWMKMHGQTSTSLTKLLSIPGVWYSHCLFAKGLTHLQKFVDTVGLSFRTVDELNKMIDANLSGRPHFQCKLLTVNGEPLEFYSRDVIGCIRSLYGDPEFAQHLVFAPERHYTSHERSMRIYNEIHTGDWWWKVQVSHTLIDQMPITNLWTRLPLRIADPERRSSQLSFPLTRPCSRNSVTKWHTLSI